MSISAPGSPTQQAGDPWTTEIDSKILSHLGQVKKDKKLQRWTFTVPVWTNLGNELESQGYPGFTNTQLKERLAFLQKQPPKSSVSTLPTPCTPSITSAPAPAPTPTPAPATTPTTLLPAATVNDIANWTSEADTHVITFLEDAKARGLMSESNFKGTAYSQGAKYLAEKGYHFSAKQVKNCWTRFKADFKIVAKLRLLSGFGWCPIRHMVTATDEVWDQYITGHRKAHPFRTQPFPHYDAIAGIVGHSTATGAMAQSSEKANFALDSSEDEEGEDVEEDDDQSECEEEAESPKKKRHSAASPKATPALSSLTDSIVSGSLFAPPPTDSPEKKKKAFDVVCAEEGLSPHSLAKARCVFRGRGEIAQEYLSFDASSEEEKEARHYWLLAEMVWNLHIRK
ncbi:hypothetical protein D9758_015762 [Tetrapyrgos nigripes]|uniref:Myb/SANT-like domain-containing protein n=1 Tax=Tetrapyrgos nigripes TaxID=182062 RepID=A0A8H5FIR9_9AGAR|nr:hypothetical protein D9758_015762 [Tetrapyrgos nigripes]